MSFAVIGVNHKSCPIEIREKVAFTQSKVREGMSILKEQGIREIVVLSTCNRSEIYIEDEDIDKAILTVISFYETYFKQPYIFEYLFIKQGSEALRHLFYVSAGLDSIVLGEDQILGQVKVALKNAMEEQKSGKVLNKIFREAISCAKYIKSHMKISEHPLSISHIAIKFLKEKQGSLKDKHALIIGAGQMNELTIKYLLEEEVGEVYITNRTHTKAVNLTEVYKSLIPVRYEERYHLLEEVDFVVSATASPHIILEYEKMPPIAHEMIIMDLAMPRDIDPHINSLPLVSVYDIDDLKAISETNSQKRLLLAQEAKEIIEEAIEKVIIWLERLSVTEVIQGLDSYCQQVENHTIRLMSKKHGIADELFLRQVVNEALKRCMRSPIAKLMHAVDEEQKEEYARVLMALFELDKEGER